MIGKVRNNIIRFQMLQKGDCVIVAVSGGADSMALLHVLNCLAPDFGVTMVVAHFNHGLRREAEKEALFVKKAAEEMGLPFVLGRGEIRTLKNEWRRSLEETARMARYKFLEETASKYGARKIALGHHLLDQAETVLINLIRGSGLAGLKGMEPVREGKYIRPQLSISPREIAAYVARERIKYCVDRSNFDERFLRNRIRHRLIPLLMKEFNPRIVETLAQMAEILREEEHFIARETMTVLKQWGVEGRNDIKTISLASLKELPPALRKRVIKELLEAMKPDKKAISFRHIEAVEKIVFSKPPGQVLFVPGGRVVKEYENLKFDYRKEEKETEGFSYPLSVPGEVRIGGTGQLVKASICNRKEIQGVMMLPNVLYADIKRIKPPLKVRSWQPGDRIVPLGLKGSRKVQDIMGEMKVPRAKRKLIPIIEDDGGILWIGGLKVADRCHLQPETEEVVKIEII
ncbi:MAG: tRNA lysidine(34) synthetase TilS [Syntrophales bacterium]|nr:tRNA lysidine(34) synthetase TilS [Syntrophales bacterium]